MALFGWRKDKYDYRDYLHKPKLVKIPLSADLSHLLPDVRNQGQVQSCVGFGIGANLCSIAKNLNIFTEWYSPTWIYNGARFIEGTLTQDVGCWPRDALDWLLKSGCLLEHFWPYDSNKLDFSAPSSEKQKQATKYPNFAYYRIGDGVNGICSAIAEGHLVSIGTPWFNKWYYQNPIEGILPEVTENDVFIGGHETCIYAYNLDTGYVYGINSWGVEWGKNGLFAMPMSAFEVFKQLGGYDAHYITFEASITPPEPPSPEPSECIIGNGIAGFLNVYSRLAKRRGRFYYLNK